MTFTDDDKRNILRTFIRGGAIHAIAQLYACRAATVEDIIRIGVQQIVADWAQRDDEPAEEAKVN